MYTYWNVWKDLWNLGFEAQRVIAMRLIRLTAGGPKADAECRRMILEKFAAAAAAQAAAASALIRGRNIETAATRAIAPIKRTVRANRRRLGRAKRFDKAMLVLHRMVSDRSGRFRQ
jgi:hypothetical protein